MGMSKGLLGAIGGLGDALQTVGTSLATRRERALEQARLLAAEQRKREQQVADKAEERTFTLGRDAAAEEARNARLGTQIEARRTERQEDRTFKVEDREDEQSFKEKQKADDRRAARDLAQLRGQISRDNDAASERLRKDLTADDVKGVIYSGQRKDAQGNIYAEAIIYTKSGQQRPTGRWVLKGRDRAQRDESEDDEEL